MFDFVLGSEVDLLEELGGYGHGSCGFSPLKMGRRVECRLRSLLEVQIGQVIRDSMIVLCHY